MSAPPRPVKLIVINDIVCSYCYIGHYELLAAVNHCKDVLQLPLTFDIEYRPYQLYACLGEDGAAKSTRPEWLKAKMGEEEYTKNSIKVYQWFKDRRLPCGVDDAPVVQSTRAHRLSRKAFLMGGSRYQEALLSAVFKEHMENSRDISDVDVLSDIAEDVGMMTKDDATTFLESDELKDEVLQMIEHDRKKGITGVPMVVIGGKWAVNGAQCSKVYIEIFKKLATCTGKAKCDDRAAPSSPLPAALVPAAYA